MSTSRHGADVTYNGDINDPTGGSSSRNFDQKYIKKGRIAGVVGWGSGGDVDGSVVVTTSNAPNVLTLQ